MQDLISCKLFSADQSTSEKRNVKNKNILYEKKVIEYTKFTDLVFGILVFVIFAYVI